MDSCERDEDDVTAPCKSHGDAYEANELLFDDLLVVLKYMEKNEGQLEKLRSLPESKGLQVIKKEMM